MVSVRTELTRVMPGRVPRTATFQRFAAGVVINPSGIIVTNTHTIIHAPFIFVILRDGTKLRARVIFSSKRYDFSFLKIHPPYPLSKIPWASASHIENGQAIIVIRHSDTDKLSVMAGHIKNIIRDRHGQSIDFLELDLTLRHGDSGEPILDAQGRLLGMVMARRESRPDTIIAIAATKIRRQYLQYEKSVR